MCEPAIHVLRSVFTRLVRKNLFASLATLRVLFFAYPPSSVINLFYCNMLHPTFIMLLPIERAQLLDLLTLKIVFEILTLMTSTEFVQELKCKLCS